jgi:transcriptional regulator with XRE-family HTH domain
MARNEPTELRVFIGKRLLELRQEARLTQADIAEYLDVSRGAVYQYERGIITPTVEILVAYSNKFDVTVDSLIKPRFRPRK